MDKELTQTIVRGLRARCPRCGQSSIYSGLLSVKPACEQCGLDLSREDSGDGPTVFLIFAIGLIAAIVMLVMVFALGAPIWLSIAMMIALVFGLTIALLRPSKALLIALAWHHKSGDDSAKH